MTPIACPGCGRIFDVPGKREHEHVAKAAAVVLNSALHDAEPDKPALWALEDALKAVGAL